ncbi:MAG: enoyl-CoA hydratase/isomerase family protein [Terriglobales bacterium]
MRYASCVSQKSFARVTYSVQPPVARIRLHNSSLNIIDIPMMEELSAAMVDAEAQADVSVAVLGGGEFGFSAGVDVAAHTPEMVREMLAKFHAIFRAMVTSRKVWVGVVTGHCLGGGAELAMMCDLVVTAESATWGFPEIRLGCFPPVAATALGALIGQKRASELILTGRTFDGREALALGLANAAVREGEVERRVEEWITELRQLSPVALAATKKAIYGWDSMHFDKGLARAEKIYLDELMQTEDAREGIRAFLEKREPRWRGK